MQYITGQHALNIPCPLLTCGDWHQSAIQWNYPLFRNSNDSVFGDYGIEKNVAIPEHTEKYNVANHIRALLDLLDGCLGNRISGGSHVDATLVSISSGLDVCGLLCLGDFWD